MNNTTLKHTDIQVGETVYIKAKKAQEFDSNSGVFIFGGSLAYTRYVDSSDLEGAITEKELNELRNTKFQEELREKTYPVVGEEYEFSNDGKEWEKSRLYGYISTMTNEPFSFIRPIQKKCTIEVDEKHKEKVEAYINSLK